MRERSLLKTIQRAKENLRQEQNIEAEEEKRGEEKLKKYARRERDTLKSKLSTARDIIKWSTQFGKSEIYKEFIQLTPKDSIEIYRGNWGHKLSEFSSNYGCVSEISVHSDGSLEYLANYKGLAVRKQITFKTAEELANGLNHVYLGALHQQIFSKGFESHIAKQLKELTKDPRFHAASLRKST